MIPLKTCPKGRFGNDDATSERYGIIDYYLCPPDDFKFTMQGSYSSQRIAQFRHRSRLLLAKGSKFLIPRNE